MSSSVTNFYQELAKERGLMKATGWNSGFAQFQRYRVIHDFLNYGPTDTILDYGCNVGDFYFYVREVHGIRMNYTGVDTSPEFVHALNNRVARVEDRHASACVGNLLDDAFHKKLGLFSYVVVSGVFAHQENPLEELMDRLWDHAGIGLIVNFLMRPVPAHGWRFMTNEAIATLLNRFKCPYVVRHDYLENDVTVMLRKCVNTVDDGPYTLKT